MAQRAFLSPIVVEEMSEFGGRAFKPRIPPTAAFTSLSNCITTDADGVPVYSHALIVVTASDFTAFDADPEIEALPAVPERCDDAELARLMAERAGG